MKDRNENTELLNLLKDMNEQVIDKICRDSRNATRQFSEASGPGVIFFINPKTSIYEECVFVPNFRSLLFGQEVEQISS